MMTNRDWQFDDCHQSDVVQYKELQ